MLKESNGGLCSEKDKTTNLISFYAAKTSCLLKLGSDFFNEQLSIAFIGTRIIRGTAEVSSPIHKDASNKRRGGYT